MSWCPAKNGRGYFDLSSPSTELFHVKVTGSKADWDRSFHVGKRWVLEFRVFWHCFTSEQDRFSEIQSLDTIGSSGKWPPIFWWDISEGSKNKTFKPKTFQLWLMVELVLMLTQSVSKWLYYNLVGNIINATPFVLMVR